MFGMNQIWLIYNAFLVLLPLINAHNLATRSVTDPQLFTAGSPCTGKFDKTNISVVCKEIEDTISGDSQVYYTNDVRYYDDIRHYSTSSTQYPVCCVEPATTSDLSIIMKIIQNNRVPFAVKGGGHSMNPGFSSTTGVHIAMRRFSATIFHPESQTVDVRSGQTWDDVYQALQPYNVTVLGGRVSGVGVAGFTLGGGYGWKSNQYGLTIDTVLEYELVTSNGTVVHVNNESYSDLFFGLKGGFNNFGIVTNFKMRALPQTKIYGGILFYSKSEFDAVLNAVKNFQDNNKDPKAQILCSFTNTIGVLNLLIIGFYDAATAPQYIFQKFLNIPHTGALKTRSLLAFVQSVPTFLTDNMRGRFHTLSVTNLSTVFLEKTKELFLNYSADLFITGGILLTINIEPFLPTYFNYSQGGAYPHLPSSNPPLPIIIQFGWDLPSKDEYFIGQIQSLANALLQASLNDGQYIGDIKQIRYPNYALENTPLSEMYGDNVDRLKTIRQSWDPDNVMCLAGGFKFY